jgi:phosphoribosylanthranilate isomerase
VTVKICGLTSREDALAAHEAGADYLGFVFFPASRRCLGASSCGWIRELPGRKVGVFRDQPRAWIEEIAAAAGLDLVQLHGDETPAECAALGGRGRVVKAVAVAGPVDWGGIGELAGAARILFDTASPTGGGTGRAFDWGFLAGRPDGVEFVLAGGLTPDNVAAAIARVRPAGVDVASGVESSVGRKDPEKVRAFIAAVRGLEASGSPREGE